MKTKENKQSKFVEFSAAYLIKIAFNNENSNQIVTN